MSAAKFNEEIAGDEHLPWCKPHACYAVRLERGIGYKVGTRKVRHVRRVRYNSIIVEVFVTTTQAPGGPVEIEEFGVNGLSCGPEPLEAIPFDGGWAAIVYEAMKTTESDSQRMGVAR